jgi:hypothetical protein
VSYNGRAIVVPVEDKCVECDPMHLQLSKRAFKILVGPNPISVGRVDDIQWSFTDATFDWQFDGISFWSGSLTWAFGDRPVTWEELHNENVDGEMTVNFRELIFQYFNVLIILKLCEKCSR